MELSPTATVVSTVTFYVYIFSLIPTILAIIAYFHSDSIRNAHQNILFLILLMNCLVLTTKSIIINGILSSTKKYDALNSWGCNLDGFVNFFCGGIEITTLMYIAIERYFAIVKQRQLSLKQIRMMLTIGWVLVGFMASIPLWLSSYNYVISSTKLYCLLPFRDQNQLFLNITCLLTIPASMAGICYCYAKVYSFYRSAGIRKRTINERSTALQSSGFQQESRKMEEDKERKVFYTTFLLVGWTLIGWSSMSFMMAYQVITGKAPNTEWDLISFILTGVTMCGDSIILLVSDKRWKASLKSMFTRGK